MLVFYAHSTGTVISGRPCSRTFVATNTRLSEQQFVVTKDMFCRDNAWLSRQKKIKKIVVTKDVFCRDKHVYVATEKKVLS